MKGSHFCDLSLSMRKFCEIKRYLITTLIVQIFLSCYQKKAFTFFTKIKKKLTTTYLYLTNSINIIVFLFRMQAWLSLFPLSPSEYFLGNRGNVFSSTFLGFDWPPYCRPSNRVCIKTTRTSTPPLFPRNPSVGEGERRVLQACIQNRNAIVFN